MSLKPGLYALLDDSVRPELPMFDKARAVIAAGVPTLQLRLEQTADRPALELIIRVMEICQDTTVIVNDRVDLALAGRAHGVHLGADDLPVRVARKLLGPTALIGATTRTLADIVAAKEQGADHVGLGPIFATTTKHVDHAPLGLEGFAQICARSPLPVVGIAGITLETIGAVAAAGAHCAAVAGALLHATDLTLRSRELSAAFAASTKKSGA